ncbi:DUF6708 domain-containing protein [Pseudomonas cremoricolorata]|uniref:DUF6708 domain-containing protein n=1 Tax=Pseudomonas cremoricolorata TaxID=157783 RepID=A0A089WN14_9PSED|nr:DUF6708 domain-containing protein [Pseudomonas cremoricolorata]AIR90635.1 hypothetical protein LK03_15750 [Pseudomonas cremoricolorata]
MSTVWMFKSDSSYTKTPAINGQASSITHLNLSLHNPWVTDSVFMAKLYCAMIMTTMTGLYPFIFAGENWTPQRFDLFLIIGMTLGPFIFLPFLMYRIWLIKGLSTVCFNRSIRKIYYKRFRKLFIFDWDNTAGGLMQRTEFGGSSFSTMYSLAFAPYREDGTLHQKDALWIDSNEPTESDVQYVAEVWEYLRQFMDHGPDNLPPPGPANWWHKPLHAICLTPAEAWRHYAPWRTGESGEMQGKKNWQLPFWAVLFPYNLTVAICWYGVCKLFNVKAAPPPPEALEPVAPERTGGSRP